MSFSPGCRRAATTLLCALGAGLATAAPAHAGAADQIWNCRASAAYVGIPAQDRTEPVVANGSSRTSVESSDRGRCADDEGQPVGPGNELGLEGPVAQTAVNPDSGLAVDQSVTAKAAVADFAPGQLGNSLVVRAARAEATATCTANGPVLSGSSEVPVVTLGGRTLDITPLEQIVERLPTGEIVRIRFNEQTRNGNTLTQRAVHLDVQDPLGRVVKDVVVAEAKVSGGSQVCDRAAQEATANGDGGGSGDSGPCIRGAEYVPA